MNYYSTRVVIDMATGSIIERDRVPYDGPWELAKKDPEREQERKDYLAQQAEQRTRQANVDAMAAADRKRSQEIEDRLFAKMDEQFKRVEEQQRPIREAMQKYISGDVGYTPEQEALLQSKFAGETARGYEEAGAATRTALRRRGSGGGDLPTGGDYVRGISSLESAKASTLAGGRRDIRLSSIQQALMNKFNAAGVLSGTNQLSAGIGGNYLGGAETYGGLGAGARNTALSVAGMGPSAPFGAVYPKPAGFWQQFGRTALGAGIGVGAGFGANMLPTRFGNNAASAPSASNLPVNPDLWKYAGY